MKPDVLWTNGLHRLLKPGLKNKPKLMLLVHLAGYVESLSPIAISSPFLDCLKVTLNVISSAGFGQHFPWNVPTATANHGSTLTFPTAIKQSIDLAVWRAITPNWAYRLPISVLERTKLAYDELERHIYGIIRDASYANSEQEGKIGITPGSLLMGLLEANGTIEDESRLSDQELLANIYVSLSHFMSYVSGVTIGMSLRYFYLPAMVRPSSSNFTNELFSTTQTDTTAHTLSFVIAIFALYPDIHARVRSEADAVWPDSTSRQSSTYKSDFPRLVSTIRAYT